VSRLLSGDTLLRAVSLGLAIVLWVVIAGRYTAERGLTVPVELRNFPPDLELTGDLVNSVNVRLRASPGLVESLDPGQVLVRIDLKGAEEGEHIIQLTSEHIEVPFGFRVVKITPSLLTINLERSLSKTLPVRPRILGQPAPGYEVEAVTSEPAEVRVRGPRSRVQEIESAFTEPVSVQGADVTVEQYVNVGLEDPLLNLESAESQEVKVVVRIRERQEERLFEGLPVAVRGQPSRLSPSSVSAEVRGPARVLRDLDPGDLRAYVNVPPDHEDGRPLPVAVEIAPGHTGTSVVRTEPAEVKARLLTSRRQP
jgi:YbbR domain-containing protein